MLWGALALPLRRAPWRDGRDRGANREIDMRGKRRDEQEAPAGFDQHSLANLSGPDRPRPAAPAVHELGRRVRKLGVTARGGVLRAGRTFLFAQLPIMRTPSGRSRRPPGRLARHGRTSARRAASLGRSGQRQIRLPARSLGGPGENPGGSELRRGASMVTARGWPTPLRRREPL
jgi:hypothetical protein